MNQYGLLSLNIEMTVFRNDPIRVRITEQDIWNLTHPNGIDSCFYPSDKPDEWFCQLMTSDISPFTPHEEHYYEDIERELYKLNIIQDHIREREPHTHFNSQKSRIIEAPLDVKVFEKDNRYDVILDKVKNPHRLRDGRLFGVIEEG